MIKRKNKISMRNIIKYIVSIFIFFICLSCKDGSKNQKFIENLATIQNDPLSPYFNYYLYFKTDNGKILQINVDGLYEIYKSSHPVNDKNFENYLKNLFNQKEVIKIKDIEKFNGGNNFFSLNEVAKHINNMSIEEIEQTYLEKEKESFRLVPKKKLNSSEISTILFKMFNDGFIISPNDLIGYYTIRKYNEEDFK